MKLYSFQPGIYYHQSHPLSSPLILASFILFLMSNNPKTILSFLQILIKQVEEGKGGVCHQTNKRHYGEVQGTLFIQSADRASSEPIIIVHLISILISSLIHMSLQSITEKDMALTPSLNDTNSTLHNDANPAAVCHLPAGSRKAKYRKQRRSRATSPGKCHSCRTSDTPEWRRGPDGARTLCNACGLREFKLASPPSFSKPPDRLCQIDPQLA